MLLGTFGIAICIAIGFVTWYEWRNRSPMLLFWATAWIVFFLPATIDALAPGEVAKAEVVAKALLFAVLFSIAYAFGRLVTQQFRQKRLKWTKILKHTETRNVSAPLTLWFAIIFLVAALACRYLSVVRVADSLFAVTWRDPATADTLTRILHQLSRQFFYIGGVAPLVAWIQERRMLAMMLFLGGLSHVVIGRSRVELVPLVVPALLLFMVKGRRLRFRRLAATGVMVVVALYVGIYGLQYIRYQGGLRSAVDEVSVQDYVEHLQTVPGEADKRLHYYTMLERPSKFSGAVLGATYRRLLVFWYPSALGDLKPENPHHTLRRDITGREHSRASLHPTVFGDAYYNFGWAGVVVGLLWGALAVVIQWPLSAAGGAPALLMLGPICTGVIVAARGSVYNGAVIVILGCMLVSMVLVVVRILVNSGLVSDAPELTWTKGQVVG